MAITLVISSTCHIFPIETKGLFLLPATLCSNGKCFLYMRPPHSKQRPPPSSMQQHPILYIIASCIALNIELRHHFPNSLLFISTHMHVISMKARILVCLMALCV